MGAVVAPVSHALPLGSRWGTTGPVLCVPARHSPGAIFGSARGLGSRRDSGTVPRPGLSVGGFRSRSGVSDVDTRDDPGGRSRGRGHEGDVQTSASHGRERGSPPRIELRQEGVRVHRRYRTRRVPRRFLSGCRSSPGRVLASRRPGGRQPPFPLQASSPGLSGWSPEARRDAHLPTVPSRRGRRGPHLGGGLRRSDRAGERGSDD